MIFLFIPYPSPLWSPRWRWRRSFKFPFLSGPFSPLTASILPCLVVQKDNWELLEHELINLTEPAMCFFFTATIQNLLLLRLIFFFLFPECSSAGPSYIMQTHNVKQDYKETLREHVVISTWIMNRRQICCNAAWYSRSLQKKRRKKRHVCLCDKEGKNKRATEN